MNPGRRSFAGWRIFRLQSVLLSLLAVLVACQSQGAYLKDRGNDLSDILRVRSTLPAAGFALDVGPVSTGLYLGGIFSEHAQMTLGLGAGCDLLGQQEESRVYGKQFNEDYIRNKLNCHNKQGFILPAYGRIRLHLGLMYGGNLELNWLEALDFAVGLLGIDLLADDFYRFRERALQDYQENPAVRPAAQ